MTMLITLDQGKAHLRVTHDAEDTDIEAQIHAASALVINYLKDAADTFLDSSGEVVTDSSDLPVVPYEVQAAVKLMLGDLYKNREPKPDDVVDGQYGYGYLPRAVVALLYNLRDPTLA
jgi:phosphate uptake regulator